MPSLFSVFSAEIAATLDHLAARLSALAPASGPRVLIVPGLPGTLLGHPGPPPDLIWFDLAAVREGRFVELATGAPGPPVEALGAVEPIYLHLILRLRLAGYDVGFFPYDWRRPLRDVGRDLSDRIRDEGREVHVIAHSFGSLVARAAAVTGTPDLGRVIMLGPSNHGTFAMVQGLRGSHWALRMVSALDGTRTAVDLARDVVATWRSIPEALPDRLLPGDVDLLDLDQWPAQGLRPTADALREAREVQAWLASSVGRFSIIAGHGLPTVERVEREGGSFRYHLSDDGDGFVTTARTRLDGYPVHHVRSAHTGMPGHPDVVTAILDLLRDGATLALPEAPPPASPCPSFTDEDLPEPPFAGRRGLAVDAADVRALFDELVGVAAPTLV